MLVDAAAAAGRKRVTKRPKERASERERQKAAVGMLALSTVGDGSD